MRQVLRLDREVRARILAVYHAGWVDTPAYRLAANYSGRTTGPKGDLASPEKIARVGVRCREAAPRGGCWQLLQKP